MSAAISEPISLFRSLLESRRFGDGALRILESALVARDVESLMAARSAVRELLRSESMVAMREVAEKSVDHKLRIAEFFVRAFALAGDVESCLALKYEAFVLRDSKFFTDNGMRVSHEEWLQFAKDSLENGFHMIAVKGFENALASIQFNNNSPQPDAIVVGDYVVHDIKELRDMAAALTVSHSIQVHTAKYLKRKATAKEQKCSIPFSNAEPIASAAFRRGIKKRHMQKLIRSRALPVPAGFEH